jgi:transcriptional regulator with XRE-family HTH domain
VTDSAVSMIGPRLKSWRLRRSMTLAELSRVTSISASTISRLESGKRAPNLELVVPIARALRLELDDIIPLPAPDPRVRRVSKHTAGVTYESLSPASSPVKTYKLTLPPNPGGSAGVPDPGTHDGYEWLYVLDGRLRLVLGDHDIVMGPGEAAEFDTRTPHWMCASGTMPVELLTIFSTQGKRIHLRARPAASG